MVKKISVLTGCYNEEENIELIYKKVKDEFVSLPGYEYEHIFIDNASTDNTVNLLRKIAEKDKNIKIILNNKNFGPTRSAVYGILQCHGDAVIHIVADLQDPPEHIPEMIKQWENGNKLVIGIRDSSDEKNTLSGVRRFYYWMLSKISETEHIKNFTGFGLYDKSFVELLRQIPEPYPYLRGFVSEFGFKRYELHYHMPKRNSGKTKLSMYTLYDVAMTGIVNHSRLPLRIAAFIGFFASVLSFLFALFYFIYKLVFWNSFDLGIAPLVIGLFLFASVQLFFIGIVGEYIGAIFLQVKNRPLVIERERINFD
jgi:glycosyltransferase involved in cell wall biosynthesis